LIGAQRFPKYYAALVSGCVYVKLAAYFLGGVSVALIVWPLAMLWTVAPFAFGQSLSDRLFTYFRRTYIDDEKWQAVLATTAPPPKLLLHEPMLGCDGQHDDWSDPGECPCFAKCTRCGSWRPTEAYFEAMQIPPEVP
jgi:hypothetical protein